MDKSTECKEWLEFAERDLAAATVLNNNHPRPLEIICFHCQQSAEKYLKAFLVQNEIPFEKTHNLILLNSMCCDVDNRFKAISLQCNRLNVYSVLARYPSNLDISNLNALTALEDALKVKELVLASINI